MCQGLWSCTFILEKYPLRKIFKLCIQKRLLETFKQKIANGLLTFYMLYPCINDLREVSTDSVNNIFLLLHGTIT